ncbi:MAG: HNH endonuclease [Desulfatiglandales bacterium]
MDISFEEVSEASIAKEKAKARALRKTHWWQRKLGLGICYYCGKNVGPQNLTMDHIVPLSRGGKTTKGNVVPACKECNNKKKWMLPWEWEEYLQRLKSGSLSIVDR